MSEMTSLSNSPKPHHIVFLAICIAVSTCGITASRPVLQIGTLRFPYAETLPFPYPLTTALFQFICAHTCLWLYSFFHKSHDGPDDQESGSLTGSKVFKGVLSLDWASALRILPLAGTVAAEAALSNYVLYSMPFEVYLLSRAAVLPFLLLLDRFVYGKAGSDKFICPSIMLSTFVSITAFKPPLPHSARTFLIALLSPLMSALWPLQVQVRTSSVESLSKGEYAVVGSAKTASKRGRMGVYPTWQLIYHTSLLGTIILAPIVLYSGEPGHIVRNCYLLKEPRFWVYMAAGGIFRLTFFISTIILIGKTSAIRWAFVYVFANINQVGLFAFDTLRRLQLVGLTGASLSLVWAKAAATDLDTTWISLWKNDRPALRRRLYSLALPILVITVFGILSQVFHKEGIVNTAPPRDRDDTGDFPASLFTSMVEGNDSYLGHRPPVNTVINLKLLMEECARTNSTTTRDTHRCLEFLSMNQDAYFSTSSKSHQVRSDEATPDSLSDLTNTDETGPPPKLCDGPVIPYHIWWSGLPTWRVELFVKAYLYTQNVQCSKLWIWVDGKHNRHTIEMWFKDPRFKRFMPLVETGDIIVTEWTLPSRVPLPPRDGIYQIDKARYHKSAGRSNSMGELMVADSVVQDATGQEWLQIHDGDNQISYYDKAISDIARFTIIHMYGGIYLDTGTILLRDIRPLLLSNVPFIEKPDPKEPFGNAVIALPANSSISSYILRGGTRMGLLFHATVLQRMFEKEHRDGNDYENGGLVRLEDAILDPIWAESHKLREGRCTVPCLNNFVSVFRAEPVQNEWESFKGESLGGAAYNRTMENFYRGAFAYHLHGQKKSKYERGSWMDVICSAHDRWFAGMQSNPYGEKWSGHSIAPYRHSS